jgi:alanine racemase
VRATVAEIDLTAIAQNIQNIKKQVSPAAVMAVVKADAYGHGAVPVSKAVLNAGASHLAVAFVQEALELRRQGIKAPILVFAGCDATEADDYVKAGVQCTLYTHDHIRALEKSARRHECTIPVHIKIDTGMGRVGQAWDQALPFVQTVASHPLLNLTGIYTHFSTSDELDKQFTYLQLYRFNRLLEQIREAGIHIPIIHAANSGAILDVPEAYFNMVRPGVMMYGHYPSTETTESVAIRPAMTFQSRIHYIKRVTAGTSISYGRTFIAPRNCRIATLPVGYADGYNRLLSNQATVLIRGKRFPVVGRICMDACLVDLGEDEEIQAGDTAVLFGEQGHEAITVQSICERLGTIPYEVTCWVSKRVPRLYRSS